MFFIIIFCTDGFAPPLASPHAPLGGRAPQFGNHCYRVLCSCLKPGDKGNIEGILYLSEMELAWRPAKDVVLGKM